MEELVQNKYKNPTRLEVEVIKHNKVGKRGEAKKISILLRDIQAIGTPAFFGDNEKRYAFIIAQGICYETNESFGPLMDRFRDLYDQPGQNPISVVTEDGGFVICDLWNTSYFYTVGSAGCVNLWAIRSVDHLTHEVTFVDNTKRLVSTTDKAWKNLAERRNTIVINTQKLADELTLKIAKDFKAINQPNESAVWRDNVKKMIEIDENSELAFGLGCLNFILLLLVIIPMLIALLCK